MFMDEHSRLHPNIRLAFLDNNIASKLINSSTEFSRTYNQMYLNIVR